LPPLTAGYRILVLDGGGVRGINQLVVLRKIQEEVGLPVHLFFDLAVGTSVGKRAFVPLKPFNQPLALSKISLTQ
jgi:patatin-like phospholipase/acyl hydrolase